MHNYTCTLTDIWGCENNLALKGEVITVSLKIYHFNYRALKECFKKILHIKKISQMVLEIRNTLISGCKQY